MSTLGFTSRSAARIGSAVLFLPVLAAAAAGPGGPWPVQDPPLQAPSAQIVVLVDESGSLSPDDVARERDAVRLIVQGEPSPESTVSVVGFASADAPGQSAVDRVCPPTQLNTPQNRQSLADCAGLLRRRDSAEGDGTDHVAALREALNSLSVPAAAGQPKIVFLLTDGELDVSKSPAYGGNSDDRNSAAKRQVPSLLAELSRAGVQVWPLGFGTADRAQLDGFATGAAQDRCGATAQGPTASVITDAADLSRAIGTVYSAARCFPIDQRPVGGIGDLSGVRGELTLEGDGTDVVAGTSLNGTAKVTNSTGQPRTLRIEVTEPSPGAVVAVEPTRLTVPGSGQETMLPFTLRFDPATAVGSNQARLRLVDESDGALVGQLLFARDVVPEPSPFWRLWWRWLLLAAALAAVLAGGVIVARRWLRRERAKRDVHGARVELRRRGQVIDTLTARHHGAEFRFGVRRDEDTPDVGLTTGQGGDRYRVRRGRDGLIVIEQAAGTADPGELVEPGQPGEPVDLGDSLELVVHDRPAGGLPDRRGDRQQPYDPYADGAPGDRSGTKDDPYATTS